MASQSAKNMLYYTCETGKLSGGAPGPVGSSPYGKISVCGRSMKKRILSCLMALVLCLTLLPTAALAGETEGTAQTPFLGCLRAKSRLTAAALRNTPAGVARAHPSPARGMQHP